MKKAFSLIELLVSLIIISLIAAVFSPILTKNLKNNLLSLNSKDSIKTDCSNIDSENKCRLCIKNECIVCTKNCEKGYSLEPLSCKCLLDEKKYTDAPCLIIGNICVAKFNAGDINGLSVSDALMAKDVKKNDGTYYGIGNIQNTVDNPAKGTTSTPTCWIGVTSSPCESNPASYGGYNACNRTVCNWYAADKICKYHNWRLPTDKELEKFANYSTQALGSSGLQLCSEELNPSFAQCKDTTRCSLDLRGVCRAHDVWGAESGNTVYHGCMWPSWNIQAETTSYRYDYAESVRCVRDL